MANVTRISFGDFFIDVFSNLLIISVKGLFSICCVPWRNYKKNDLWKMVSVASGASLYDCSGRLAEGTALPSCCNVHVYMCACVHVHRCEHTHVYMYIKLKPDLLEEKILCDTHCPVIFYYFQS